VDPDPGDDEPTDERPDRGRSEITNCERGVQRGHVRALHRRPSFGVMVETEWRWASSTTAAGAADRDAATGAIAAA
jgi:hypothetical protein